MAHPSYSNTSATAQTVSEAIEQSKAHNEIVRLGYSEEAAARLFLECDDTTDAFGVVEYWGKDLDGNEWRVHLDREVAS